ncbi:MAG: hypothetical protein RLZZ196_1364 [Bacteroidota bacterium]|jgi:hypothetical protein
MMKKEKMRLYLDDVRTPLNPNNESAGDIPQWQVVRTYEEFVAHIRLNGLQNYEVISLDHDLGKQAMEEYYNNVHPNYTLNYDNIVNEKTGYDAAKWLVAESMKTETPLPAVYVHSANPIGSANIMGYINNYLMNCRLPQTCVRVKIPHKIEGHDYENNELK